LPTEDKFLSTKGEMLDEIAMMLGGRVAEEIAIGDITTGASNDIERATKLARQMVTRYGMSDKLGPMTLGEDQHEVFLGRDFTATPNYSPEIAYEIDKEVRRLIDEAFETAYRILTERREQLDLIAQVLVERETVDKEELEALLNGTWEQYLEQEAQRAAEEQKAGKRKGRASGKRKEAEEPAEDADERPIVDVPSGDVGGSVAPA
jgi:cell division protease FtsH